MRFWRLRHFPSREQAAASIRFRALENEALYLRPGTSDAQVAWYTLKLRVSLPPPGIGSPGVIVDLGANIGVASAQLATRFPEATILAVEPDPGNAAACRRNLAAWQTRCTVVEAAVWSDLGSVHLVVAAGAEDSSYVSSSRDGLAVQAITLEGLVGMVGSMENVGRDSFVVGIRAGGTGV
jgi:FkbM family methyltransferase